MAERPAAGLAAAVSVRGRRCLPESCCGWDIDDLFEYSMPKQATIRDARLGILHLLFLSGVALYVGVYEMVWKMGYLARYHPSMTVRLSLQEPVLRDCNPHDLTCRSALPAFDQMPYCCRAECRRDGGGGGSCACPWQSQRSYDCAYEDGSTASIARQSSVLISTLVHTYEQVRNTSCDGGSVCTKLWNSTNDTLRYVAGIEDFTLLIDHTLRVPDLNIIRPSWEMQGFLYVNGTSSRQRQLCKERADAASSPDNGAPPTNDAPCYLQPYHTPGSNIDFFMLGVLLQAADVALDEGSLRYDGFAMQVEVEYFNVPHWHGRLPGSEVRYVYHLKVNRKSPYKASQEFWIRYPTDRRLESRHGVLVELAPTGMLMGFDAQTLLLNLTASLTLIAMASLVTNSLALYVLKHRGYYNRMVYERSCDFSEVTQLEAMSDAQLAGLLAARGLSEHGSRIERVLRLIRRDWKSMPAAPRGAAEPPAEVAYSPPPAGTTSSGSAVDPSRLL